MTRRAPLREYLPTAGRSLGSGLSNFKKGLKDGEEVSPPPPAKVAVRVEEPPKARLEASPSEPSTDTKDPERSAPSDG